MMLSRRRLVLVLGLLLMVWGCGRPSMRMLAGVRFPPKDKHADIDLYVGTIQREHVAVAVINSISLPDDDEAARRRQMEDLKKRARRLGADAVHNIRSLKQKGRGYVPDKAVPFWAWRQGEYRAYLLRGTAIRYASNPSGEQPADEEVQ
jgi:hypothetical protein